MRKLLLVATLLIGIIGSAKSQTTIHGQAEPVDLYDLIDGQFFKITTSDIWVYADGGYGVAIPYTLTPSAPPTIEGIPLIDFRPMACSQAKSDFGTKNVKCGPYYVTVVSNEYIKNCSNTDNTTCMIKWREEGKDVVVWNPQVD